MPLEKILITVKTYPTLSQKYDELVCTAGFREDGSWIRIYPIQFRNKPYFEQYKKYQWVELDLVKNTSDFRRETYRPVSLDTPIKILDEIKSDNDAWHERRRFALKKVYTNLEELIIEAKDSAIGTSLCTFKPTRILDFVYKPDSREWPKDKLDRLTQLSIFESINEGRKNVVKKLPYKFSYIFEDANGKESTMMIEDWETGQLYWNCLRQHDGDEEKACMDVRKKYFNDFAMTKDLFFYLGTTLQFHKMAPNPFIIIGTFHPKPLTQLKLF